MRRELRHIQLAEERADGRGSDLLVVVRQSKDDLVQVVRKHSLLQIAHCHHRCCPHLGGLVLQTNHQRGRVRGEIARFETRQHVESHGAHVRLRIFEAGHQHRRPLREG